MGDREKKRRDLCWLLLLSLSLSRVLLLLLFLFSSSRILTCCAPGSLSHCKTISWPAWNRKKEKKKFRNSRGEFPEKKVLASKPISSFLSSSSHPSTRNSSPLRALYPFRHTQKTKRRRGACVLAETWLGSTRGNRFFFKTKKRKTKNEKK